MFRYGSGHFVSSVLYILMCWCTCSVYPYVLFILSVNGFSLSFRFVQTSNGMQPCIRRRSLNGTTVHCVSEKRFPIFVNNSVNNEPILIILVLRIVKKVHSYESYDASVYLTCKMPLLCLEKFKVFGPALLNIVRLDKSSEPELRVIFFLEHLIVRIF